MLGRTTGAVLLGVDARVIEVEVDLGGGLPTMSAVGLPDSAIREGIDRIRSALPHCGFTLPQRKIVVNLAPAGVRKHGPTLDLPMATALLLADDQIPHFDTNPTLMVGELSLDGTLRPVRGALSIALRAREAGKRCLLVPTGNADEAGLVKGLHVIGLSTLEDLRAFAGGLRSVRPAVDGNQLLAQTETHGDEGDLADVRGQAAARRALEVAAAGGHHLLLSGPPGSGKTMLARRLPGVLPPLNLDEALAVTRVFSAAGLSHGLVKRRPFRAPHHAISYAGLTGGGAWLRPGEITLASMGVLYLDELTEFRRDALEALRQPLEDGTITVVRVHASATFPARFTLVASMNPCACGYHGAPDGRCRCTPQEVRRYRAKLSGPLLDRFDLFVDVPAVDLKSLADAPGECSKDVRARVTAARTIQHARFAGDGSRTNAQMRPAELNRHAVLGHEARRLLLAACDRLGLSARGFDRVRRVARTLADLEGNEGIQPHHVAEAVQYRATFKE